MSNNTVELFGETFDLHPKGVSEASLCWFALDSRDAQEAEDSAGMQAALADLCLNAIAEHDRRRFRRVTMKNSAEIADLMKVIQRAGEIAAERPTSPPSVSSPGPTSIAPRSESVSEQAARLKPGRPDLQRVLAPTAAAG